MDAKELLFTKPLSPEIVRFWGQPYWVMSGMLLRKLTVMMLLSSHGYGLDCRISEKRNVGCLRYKGLASFWAASTQWSLVASEVLKSYT